MSSDPSSTVYIGSKVELYIQYNGVWEQNDNSWIFKDAESSIILIDDDVTYVQLIDLLYEECEIDKSKYDLKLEAPYQVKNGQPFKPVEIKKDAHVRLFIQKTLKDAQTLCVTPVKKVGSIAASPQCLPETPMATVQNCVPIEGYVPQYDDDQNVENLSNDIVVAENCLSSEGLDTGLIWTAPNLSNLDVMTPRQHNSSSSNVPSTKFHVLQIFESKIQLKTEAALYAIKNHFEYQVKKSGTDVWYITCKAPNCTWKLRGRKLKNSSLFEIVVYHGDHTCALDVRQKNHRQAAPWVVGHLLKNKYATDGTSYVPNDIRDDMKQQYGIDMSYEKAWRCREKALMYVRGTVEESYSNLPSYLHMLQKKNPGTIIDFVVEDERFQYCFFALGASIKGFKCCRPVICVDGTFLNTKFGGYMLCAVALDANNHMFPIAHAIVDSANHHSYYYFMSKLKEAVGDIKNLAFVSDRNDSVVHAVETVFPNAYHGTCYHHITMDVQDKFNTNHCHHVMYMAAYAFCKPEFHKHFDAIKIMDPAIATYLEGISFDKWSRAYFPGNRCNVMTSNYIESFNNKTKDARAFPVTTLVEFIRFTLQSLFAQRQDEVIKCNDRLATIMEQDLRGVVEKAMFKRVEPLGQNEFLCYDDEGEYQVDLLARSCDCGMFQITGIPCPHAVGASRKRGVDIYSLCSPFYTVETWRETYKETIYPCGNEKEWDVPDSIRTMQVGVPVEKNPVGRPRKNKRGRPKIKNLPSMGEVLVKPRNLDERVSDRVLYDILIQAGRVVDLHIPRDKETDRPKGFAFAEYETEEIADYAVRLFTGLVTLYNRTLRFGISGQDKATPNLQAPSMLTSYSPFNSRLHEDVATSPLPQYARVDFEVDEDLGLKKDKEKVED